MNPVKDLDFTKKDCAKKYMEDKTIKIGVIGNSNTGKSSILKRLSKYKFDIVFNKITEGLSIKYPKREENNIPLLNSKGQEIKEKENPEKNEISFLIKNLNL